MAAKYTIGTLAQAAEVSVETVRYYQRRELLPEPPRPPGGIRRYGETHLSQLRFIRHAQELGFTLDEVAELLALDEGRDCDEARRLAEIKLTAVRLRLSRLRRIERALTTQVRACKRSSKRQRCSLIATLAKPRTGQAGTQSKMHPCRTSRFRYCGSCWPAWPRSAAVT